MLKYEINVWRIETRVRIFYLSYLTTTITSTNTAGGVPWVVVVVGVIGVPRLAVAPISC